MKKQILVYVFLFFSSLVSARILHVPGEYANIQAAIDAAVNGDGILVSPGTYSQDLNFHGKAIVLASQDGPEVTKIWGAQIQFVSNETYASLITGFMLGGFGGGNYGPVVCLNSSPSIIGNVFCDSETYDGSSIYIYSGSPFIANNEFYENYPIQSEYCNGGSIYAEDCESVIVNNYFHDNIHSYASCIEACFSELFVMNNLFVDNEWSEVHADGSLVHLWNNTFIDDFVTSCPDGSYHSRNNIFYIPESTAFEMDAGRNLTGNPLFAEGPYLPYYLSQVAAGQSVNSPAFESGVYNPFMHLATTRTDYALDDRFTDIGFHFRLFLPSFADSVLRQKDIPDFVYWTMQSVPMPAWLPSYFWMPVWQDPPELKPSRIVQGLR